MLFVLLFGVFCSVSAQEPEVSSDDIEAEIADFEIPHFSKIDDPDLMSKATADVVQVNNNKITIQSNGVLFTVEIDPNLGYWFLTQDFKESVDTYLKYMDPQYIWNFLLSYDIHLWAEGTYSNSVAYAYFLTPDSFSRKVKNFSAVPEELQLAYMEYMLDGEEITKTELLTLANGMAWMRLEDCTYVTIVGGEYIVFRWESYDEVEMSEDDALDMQDLLSCITITPL